VTADAWNRPSACVAAQSVFSLAQENPVLRPSSSAAAEQCAAALAPGVKSIPRPIVEEVIAALPDDDVGRLVGLAERVAADRWRALVAEVGTRLAREPLLVGVASAAVAELVPPPRWLVAMREATADEAPGPVNVLASLLHPESVWSAGEICAAHARASSLSLPEQLAAIISFANSRVTEWHRHRARLVAGSVAPLLPMAEAPATSRHLADALELIGRRSTGGELCRLLLVNAVLRLDGLVPIVPSQN
jgi:hypothetical protein